MIKENGRTNRIGQLNFSITEEAKGKKRKKYYAPVAKRIINNIVKVVDFMDTVS